MKARFYFFVIFFAINFAKSQDYYFPQVFFDEKLAKSMLALGNSTIEGVATTKQRVGLLKIKPLLGERHYAEKGTVVMLFPITPYFEEWYRLRRRLESKTVSVYMSKEAFKYRIDTTTDEHGRFKFEKLKPGKYYLETIVNFKATGRYQQQTGRTDAYNAYGGYLYSTPIYETFFYNYADSNRETKFVEIKTDGEILEISL